MFHQLFIQTGSLFLFLWHWFLQCALWKRPPPNVIIGICGKKGVGKDTSAGIIQSLMWSMHGDWYKHRAFAKPLKEVVQILTQCPHDKLNTHEGKESVFYNPFTPKPETFRDILKAVGKATRCYLANWIDQRWKRDTEAAKNWRLPNLWVVSDLRLDDELKWMRAQKGEAIVFVVHVWSPYHEDGMDRDISEVSVDAFPKNEIDFTIENNHWDDNQQNLEEQCQRVCQAILYRVYRLS